MSLLAKAQNARVSPSDQSVGNGKTGRSVSQSATTGNRAEALIDKIEEIYKVKDLETLLERVLFEARRFVGADAGTLYLVANGRLYFSYVQNDTLFGNRNVPGSTGQSPLNRYIATNTSLPLNKSSLAGYVASSGETLLIDNVYDIRSGVNYSFNPDVDRESTYRTRSMMVVPLKTHDEVVLGVLQLINKTNEEGTVVPFSMQDRSYINQFARNAAGVIEKAKLSREMVLRLIEVVELRDPYETGEHAKRVAAYSVELYEAWARKHGVSEEEIAQFRDPLRTAAILHDIGKVAVSDIIMKKPGELTPEERRRMKLHTIFGARLFLRRNSMYDEVAFEVTLNHHERWDGRGYPGHIANLHDEKITFGIGKRAEEIPMSARIVTVADVYDALTSDRSYKSAWDAAQAQEYLVENSGTVFDPELTEMFLEMTPVLHSIREKYAVRRDAQDNPFYPEDSPVFATL